MSLLSSTTGLHPDCGSRPLQLQESDVPAVDLEVQAALIRQPLENGVAVLLGMGIVHPMCTSSRPLTLWR